MTDFTYEGHELEDFARAANWKAYWMRLVRECLRGAVLEVGAGIGSNTLLLRSPDHRDWVCLEPDARSADTLRRRVQDASLAESVAVITGNIHDLDRTRLFDAILYADVLEHIEYDASELRRANMHLAPGGRLIVLAPAHQYLYSPFDAAIGHFRRYDAGMIRAFELPGLVLEHVRYLDSAGLLASLGNRLFLRQSLPTERQIACWDGCLVPCSRVVDLLFGYRAGKSLLAVWKKEDVSRQI
jgi:SAM-dependent methyltransferase